MKKIICIVGPTGSGKSGVSLDVSLFLKEKGIETAVVNADSRQLYRDFPIVTAQPNAEEQKVCPHCLYGILESTEKTSAGTWVDNARDCISTLHSKHILPLVVGGTGMYIKTLTQGIAEIPKISDEVRQKVLIDFEEQGAESLYARLKAVDIVYANKIHVNDKQRICRALEVYEESGQNLTYWHKAQQNIVHDFEVVKIGIGIPLNELKLYLYERTEKMLELGALEEVQKALEICSDRKAPAWSGIGCKELAAHILGECSLDTALQLWNKNTKDYAKRQWTWFRADKEIRWFNPLNEGALESIKELFFSCYDKK